ncbi:GNAT family N-acetyltransferase [Kitasatospora kifunensis]|uniref:Ribosomal protein S18 acetylase RimI-like enzyme n=1 Tax=Kitasatospora kifunensis TaxID=58351 RepID=A0A7W7RBG7_KITKI|nr:GNAT family N-acetyltransferase [Kitasatospora kifunensis]MBB4928960.1 ribosomal protein S18 acetylase RimI-like enzyme [Kitasatospora kifunensis]
MSEQARVGEVTVRVLDGEATARLEDGLKAVFAEAFAEPPYGEGTVADVDRAFKRFRSQTRKPGFLASVALDPGDQVVGMAYGYPLAATTRWWDTLTGPVADDVRAEDGKRTFGLFELAVRPAWRRRGIATRMHTALTEAVTNERMLLNSRPEATAAQAAYRAWGYRYAGTAIPWEGAAPHHVLVLELRV